MPLANVYTTKWIQTIPPDRLSRKTCIILRYSVEGRGCIFNTHTHMGTNNVYIFCQRRTEIISFWHAFLSFTDPRLKLFHRQLLIHISDSQRYLKAILNSLYFNSICATHSFTKEISTPLADLFFKLSSFHASLFHPFIPCHISPGSCQVLVTIK